MSKLRMDKIDSNLVLKLAALAKLSIEESEIQPMVDSLQKIFKHVQSLHAVDVSSVEPLTHVHESAVLYREDLLGPEAKELQLKI